MKIRDKIHGKSFKQRCNLKGKAVKDACVVRDFNNKKIRVVIDSINEIEGGVEVFARAYKGKKQLGFGEDGTVDLERFRILNPPTQVEDENGDIVIESVNSITGEITIRKLREDPQAALQEALFHTVQKVAKDGKNIIDGKIGNTTSTFYPSYDALLWRYDNAAYATAWAGAHSSTAADAVVNTALANGNYFGLGVFTGAGNAVEITRTGVFFDTSIIGTDTITSGTFSAYVTSKQNTNNDGRDYINLVQATPATNTQLVVGDFDQLGAVSNPPQGATALDIGSITTGAYNDWILNATGISWINKTSITTFGVREGHDIENVLPAASANQYNSILFYHSEQAGTSTDPVLVLVHSAATTTRHFMPLLGVG